VQAQRTITQYLYATGGSLAVAETPLGSLLDTEPGLKLTRGFAGIRRVFAES
jgi:hypothetical protein